MHLEQDVSSINRLWLAIESRYRNRQSYFANQSSVDQLKRVDEQLQVAIFAVSNACPTYRFSDLGLPKASVVKPESIFCHLCIRWLREHDLKGLSFSDMKLLESPLIAQAIIEALLFMPQDELLACFQAIADQLQTQEKNVLAALLCLYLPADKRSQFIFKQDDFLLAAGRVECQEKLGSKFDSILGLFPNSSAIVRLCGGGDSILELKVLINTEPELAFKLLSVVKNSDAMELILQSLKDPQLNNLAYEAWLYRTGKVLLQQPLLQDISNADLAAGPLLADQQQASDWINGLDDDQRSKLPQHSLASLRESVTPLDDLLWIAQGGYSRSNQLISLLPYSKRHQLVDTAFSGGASEN